MAQPTPYDRQYNFASYQAQHPSDPLPGDQVDSELNAVKASLDETQANLALIQRDDGQLANGSVGQDQLAPELTVGLTPAIAWAPNIALAENQSVFYNLVLYRTLADCNTGPAFNAAQFAELADLSSIAAPGGTINTAQLADGCITTPKLADGAVTPTKMGGFAASKLIGRYSATAGALQTISVSGGLSLSVGGVLSLTSVTGTGDSVLAISPSLVTPDLGAATATSLAATGAVGDGAGNLRNIPQNLQTSAYTLQASDNGKHIYGGAGCTGLNVPGSVFAVGNNVVVFNNSGSDFNLNPTAGMTMIWAGQATSGTRTLAQSGLASILILSPTACVISGVGLT